MRHLGWVKIIHFVSAPPSAPVVTVTPQGDVWAGRATGLTCVTERFYPRNVTVKWAFNGSPLQSNKLTMGTNSDGTFSAQSEISVIPTASYHWGVFTCEIHHSMLGHPLSANITLDVKCKRLTMSYTVQPCSANHGPRTAVFPPSFHLGVRCEASLI